MTSRHPTTPTTASNDGAARGRAHRARWAALGAAVAVAVTGLGVAQADGSAPTGFVPVEPCRLFDHRPAPDTVGERSVALGPGETVTQQVTGQVGNCDVPAGAAAVALNVTIVGPTAASYLTIYPADVAAPLASSLNWVAGQAATPNKVDVKLSPDGAINLFNKAGQVHVLADVVGFYTQLGNADGAGVTDLQQQIDAALLELDAARAEIALVDEDVDALWRRQSFSVGVGDDSIEYFDGAAKVIRSLTIDAPATGTVTVTASHTVYEGTASHGVQCSLTPGTTLDGQRQIIQAGSGSAYVPMSMVRTFEVLGGASLTVNLVCAHFGGSLQEDCAIMDPSIAAVFTASPS